MSSGFISREGFRKIGVPVGDPLEYVNWLHKRGVCRKEPYSKDMLDLLETMSMSTYADLIYRDPLFLERVWKAIRFDKTDDPFLSTTPNVWQALYGLLAFSQIHSEMSLLSALTMAPWVHDGARLLMKDPDKQGEFVAEQDYFPDTVKPEFDTYKCDSKWALTVWDVFEKAIQHSARNEGIDLVVDLQKIYSRMHREFIDKSLLANAETEAGNATANRYATAPVAIESIDRIIACDSEEAIWGGTYTDWYDPYSTDIDREDGVGTDHNSVVLHKDAEADPDRPITDALMKELIRKCEDQGIRSPADGGAGFILTGRDTRTN